MPFIDPAAADAAATQSSTSVEASNDFAANMAILAASQRAADIDGMAACREVFRTLPAVRYGDTLLLAYYDEDGEPGSEMECIWEFAEAKPGEPVKMAETLDEMRWGALADLYSEATIMAEGGGTGTDMVELFLAIEEIVSGQK